MRGVRQSITLHAGGDGADAIPLPTKLRTIRSSMPKVRTVTIHDYDGSQPFEDDFIAAMKELVLGAPAWEAWAAGGPAPAQARPGWLRRWCMAGAADRPQGAYFAQLVSCDADTAALTLVAVMVSLSNPAGPRGRLQCAARAQNLLCTRRL